jgi:hypothetical protein
VGGQRSQRRVNWGQMNFFKGVKDFLFGPVSDCRRSMLPAAPALPRAAAPTCPPATSQKEDDLADEEDEELSGRGWQQRPGGGGGAGRPGGRGFRAAVAVPQVPVLDCAEPGKQGGVQVRALRRPPRCRAGRAAAPPLSAPAPPAPTPPGCAAGAQLVRQLAEGGPGRRPRAPVHRRG